MKLEIHSMKDDLLILEIEDIREHRPKLFIGGLEVDDDWQAWHGMWQSLKITKFGENFEEVKTKIVNFYKMEGQRNPQTGCTARSPGWGKLSTADEQYLLQNVKIINCKASTVNKTVELELAFDAVIYQDFRDKK